MKFTESKNKYTDVIEVDFTDGWFHSGSELAHLDGTFSISELREIIAEMERRMPCPNCGGKRKPFSGEDTDRSGRVLFRVDGSACEDCGTVFLDKATPLDAPATER